MPALEPGCLSTGGRGGGCAASWPPALMDAVPETLAQLDGGAGIRTGMRLWRRSGCRSLPCWEQREPGSRQHRGDGPEGNLSLRLCTEGWFSSAHKPPSSQRLILPQIRQALGFPGLLVSSDEPVAVPGQARGGDGGFLAPLHPAFASLSSSPATFSTFAALSQGWHVTLPSPGQFGNAEQRFPTGLRPRLLAGAGAGRGCPMAGSALPRAWGACRDSFYFFLLESSNGG